MKHIYFLTARSDKNKYNGFLMKPLRLFIIAAVMIPLFWSCSDFLDYNELDQYEKEDIFYEYGRVKGILTSAYTYLPDDFSSVDGAMRSSASDDAVHEWDLSDVHKFNDGSWNSIVILDDQWEDLYAGIRVANVFLKEGTGLTFDEIKYNDNYEELMAQYEYYPYEARFLRAFYYFELIKRYKNVPLITQPLTSEEANSVSPSSFDDIIDFIITECDAASANLRVTYTGFSGAETGRATKGAAMALKARALLYAASPLHNTSGDISKWVDAAEASKAIIDEFSTTYGPLPSYANAVNVLNGKETILERRPANQVRTFEEANTAVGFIGGNTGTCPTQNLVDSYEMQGTGLGIDEEGSGYDPADPFAGRDPRLAATVLYNGSTWKTLPVEVWNGGLNGPPKAHTTKTGYYLKKYLKENISLDPLNPGTDYHYWIIFRYGEVLLNYAEAMNEAYGPEGAGPLPLDNMTALDAVNIVRARASMPGFPTGMTQDAFRAKLRNERRVELAFEDHRFWDIRRWKIGDQTKEIYGVNVTKNDLDEFTYVRKLVETRVWNDRMNLYPIPSKEFFINNKLGQNPGWE